MSANGPGNPLGERGDEAIDNHIGCSSNRTKRATSPHQHADTGCQPKHGSVGADGVREPARGADRDGSNSAPAELIVHRQLALSRRRYRAAPWPGYLQPFAARTMIRHPLAWCAWSVAALAIAFIDRNPFLQGLLVLVIVNTWLPYRRSHALHLRIGLALAVIPTVFSVALSRFGEHIIVVLPAVPIVGGAWTWEALLFGATSGLALLLTVAIFGILQSTVRSADLLPLLPRPLYRAGTALALALTFAPKTISSFQSIREARQVRGQRADWRAAPSLLVPLLLTMLEQALQYAESLDARGYGSGRRSRYRPLSWSVGDVLVTGASLAALGLALAFTTAPYNPYVQLAPSQPAFVAVISVLLLALPAMAAAIPRMEHVPRHA